MADDHLKQEFDVQFPNQGWVTDGIDIRTCKGCLCLAVVVGLFAREGHWLVNAAENPR